MNLDVSKPLHLVGSLLIPFIIILFMWRTRIAASTLFMVLLLVAVLVVHYEQIEKVAVVSAIAFAMGFFSDLGLNLMSSRSSGRRSVQLQNYFREVGTLEAALFAGMLTVWLVLPSYAIWLYINARERISEWLLVPIGFLFGFFIGFFSQPTLALRPLLPFYLTTYGWGENRLWDGASVVFAIIPVTIYLMVARGSKLEESTQPIKEEGPSIPDKETPPPTTRPSSIAPTAPPPTPIVGWVIIFLSLFVLIASFVFSAIIIRRTLTPRQVKQIMEISYPESNAYVMGPSSSVNELEMQEDALKKNIRDLEIEGKGDGRPAKLKLDLLLLQRQLLRARREENMRLLKNPKLFVEQDGEKVEYVIKNPEIKQELPTNVITLEQLNGLLNDGLEVEEKQILDGQIQSIDEELRKTSKPRFFEREQQKAEQLLKKAKVLKEEKAKGYEKAIVRIYGEMLGPLKENLKREIIDQDSKISKEFNKQSRQEARGGVVGFK